MQDSTLADLVERPALRATLGAHGLGVCDYRADAWMSKVIP